jgi:hypothetical protein
LASALRLAPRQGKDRSQCRQVDFGAEGGGGQITVTKYLADIESFTPRRSIRGQSVPQAVRTDPGQSGRSHARRVTSLTRSGLTPAWALCK